MARVVIRPGNRQRIESASDSVLERVAEEIAEDARAIAPVRTGRLRDSIKADGSFVGASVDYAGYVEFGTRNMAPEPFLRPAAYKKRG